MSDITARWYFMCDYTIWYYGRKLMRPLNPYKASFFNLLYNPNNLLTNSGTINKTH